jgi:hypothetical protein
MTANELKNEFTEDLCFKDYVSLGVYPPLPPNDNNTQNIHGQKLEKESDKLKILIFIDTNLDVYINYILSLYENDALGRIAVNKFLKANSTFVPNNLLEQYKQPNAVFNLNNLMQSIVDDCTENYKEPFLPSENLRRKSPVEILQTSLAQSEPNESKVKTKNRNTT